MEGLEIVEINLSECKSIIDFRIDSNTYRKDYLHSDRLIKSKNSVSIDSISKTVMNFGAYSLCNFINFTDKGIPFLMTENIRHNYINWNIRKYVDNESHKMLYKSHCHKGELLITMAGEYLGRVAVYDKDEVCSSNQAIAKVNLKEGFNPYVISTFLNSKHGQNQINRFRTITGQPNINMSLIKSLLIPEFSEIISNNINNIVRESEYKKQQSKQTYTKAENLFLEEIGLAPIFSNKMVAYLEKELQTMLNPTVKDVLNKNELFKPDVFDEIKFLHSELDLLRKKFSDYPEDVFPEEAKEREQILEKLEQLSDNAEKDIAFEKNLLSLLIKHNETVKFIAKLQHSKTQNTNIKSFKDSFATSGRLDAEYYQKKYEQIVNKIKSKPFDTLSNLVEIKKSIEPGSKNYVKNGLPFMRVADLSKNGLSEPQKFISEHFVKANQDKINNLKPKKGTILFSKDGSVGIAYHLRQDYNGITSGAILHLNVKDENRILPEYLTLALNSKIVQMQAERDAGGSIILHWRSSEIENVVVPIINYKKQQQIASLIEESFALKKQSENLLEIAKKAVEIAIEKNEEVALKYIKDQT